ncbi:hypothetical protein ACIQZO_26325 [Streptomyces sp. NPDC097617]|uniref:hypothetical protein n=1 Tax=Streptomyces sp. NPDC097617 TaxID=3366091 RepID=UPI0038288846
MTDRAHITDDNHHQATMHRHAPEPTGYVSPAYRRWAEYSQRAAEPSPDTFTLPTTTAELDAMSYADRVRAYTEDQALYDRLTGRTAV